MTERVADPVAAQARQRPLALAALGRETVTWAEWDRRIARAAGGIASLGVSRIALRTTDRLELATLTLGAVRAGVLALLVPTRWPELLAQKALVRAGVDVAVSDQALAGLRVVSPDMVLSHEPVEAGGGDPGRLAVAVFTSGSTGTPKAAALTWRALTASARGVNSHLGLSKGDRWLLDLPVAHVGGLGIIIRCALAGATVAVPERGEPLAEAIPTLRPTHLSLVSTQLQRVLFSSADMSSVRAILLGGSAMPEDLLNAAVARGLPVSPSYGLTEMGSTVTAVPVPSSPEALATSGQALKGRDVRLAASGEIEVRGTTRFSGYLTRSGLTTPFDADGWFATGDLGRLDGEKRLIVSGRQGLMFVSGGENVQPEAIERELVALPEVAEAVVVPVEDAEFGHRPLAWVRTASGVIPDADALSTALRQTLPGFMVPVAFRAWSGAQGMKPDRQGLAARARQRP